MRTFMHIFFGSKGHKSLATGYMPQIIGSDIFSHIIFYILVIVKVIFLRYDPVAVIFSGRKHLPPIQA